MAQLVGDSHCSHSIPSSVSTTQPALCHAILQHAVLRITNSIQTYHGSIAVISGVNTEKSCLSTACSETNLGEESCSREHRVEGVWLSDPTHSFIVR
jgi:hypothetical protein